MGYDTYYKVGIHEDDFSVDEEAVIEKIEEISGYSSINEESCKWYDHEKHVKLVSLEFDCIIEVSGEGEEAGDLWRKYFYKGKMVECRAEVVYPELDVSLLKDEG